MINTYLVASKEFQPIVVTKTGHVGPVLTGVKYVVVPKGTPLSSGTLQTVETLDGQIGFFTDQLTTGYWEVGVQITDYPEVPFISCGFVRIT